MKKLRICFRPDRWNIEQRQARSILSREFRRPKRTPPFWFDEEVVGNRSEILYSSLYSKIRMWMWIAEEKHPK
jgi:hypothetical protein